MEQNKFTSRNAVLIYVSFFKFALFLIFAGNYGLFRDEFYYIECSKNLAWGYVDQPPLSALILSVSRFIFGDSIFGIRVFAYIAGSVTVFVSGLLAREMGANKFGEFVTAITVVFSGVLLGTSSYFSMNAFDVLLSASFFYLLLKLINTDDPKYWIIIGVLCGIGLMNKLTFLFLGFGLFVGLLLTSQRKYFANKNLWFAAAIAIIIFLPNIIWQYLNDFPTLEFMQNAALYKNESLSPGNFLIGALMELNPGFALIIIIALYYLFFNPVGRKYLLIGWIFVAVLLVFMFNNGKPYYMGVLFPVMLAAGAVGVEKLIERFIKKRVLAEVVVIVLLIPSFFIVTPFAIPILPVNDFIAFQETIGIKPGSGERSELGVLPQFFADRFGWEEMVQDVARAYNKLSPEEKEHVIIFGQNYGEAGAVNYYRDKYNLPPAISSHNNYWIWGKDKKYASDVYIVIGSTVEGNSEFFEEVELAASHFHPLGMPYENVDIFICRKPKADLGDVWERLKNFI